MGIKQSSLDLGRERSIATNQSGPLRRVVDWTATGWGHGFFEVLECGHSHHEHNHSCHEHIDQMINDRRRRRCSQCGKAILEDLGNIAEIAPPTAPTRSDPMSVFSEAGNLLHLIRARLDAGLDTEHQWTEIARQAGVLMRLSHKRAKAQKEKETGRRISLESHAQSE